MTSKHTVVQRLAHGVAGLSLDTVPNDVIDIAKRCLIDVCGVTLAGASTKSAKMFYDMAMESYAHGPCSIVGHTKLLQTLQGSGLFAIGDGSARS